MEIISCGSIKRPYQRAQAIRAQNRHLPVLGKSAQERLSGLTIGVVGLGGIGSEIVDKVKRLFPRRLILVDNDRIEATNLNRVVGSTFVDAQFRLKKTALAKREVTSFNPGQDVTIVDGDFLVEETQRHFVGCDFIFSATDNVSSRFAVCAFGLQNGIAVIDVATGVIMNGVKVSAAGGQVFWLTPSSGWCPHCSGLYDGKAIANGLLDPAEYERQRAQGYVRGENIAAPQVGALNAILAGLAIWLFMGMVSGKEISFDGIAFNALTYSSHTWREPRASENLCPHCSEGGSLMHGDSAHGVYRASGAPVEFPAPCIKEADLPVTSPASSHPHQEYPISALIELVGMKREF